MTDRASCSSSIVGDGVEHSLEFGVAKPTFPSSLRGLGEHAVLPRLVPAAGARIGDVRLPEPMLLRSGRLPTSGDYAFEPKWDGFRLVSRRRAC
jgi:hypothetical protein